MTVAVRYRELLRWLSLKRVLAANLAVFAVVGWGFSGEFVRNREMGAEIDRLKEEAAQVEARNADLAFANERAGSVEALEREARLKLNLKKPGEQVVVVNGVGSRPHADADPAKQGGQEPDGNFGKWWKLFFR